MSKIDNAEIRSPPDSPLQPAIEGGDDGESIDEINLEDLGHLEKPPLVIRIMFLKPEKLFPKPL